MFTVCLRYTRNRAEAGEILQEGFIKVFSALHQYRGEGSLEGWIRKVMVTTVLQYFRSRSSLHAVVSIDCPAGQAISENESIESNLSAKELLALVQTLPTVYRMVFNLYVFEGYRHREIAELLHISEGTSKSNLHDARQLLKTKVEALTPDHKKKQCL